MINVAVKRYSNCFSIYGGGSNALPSSLAHINTSLTHVGLNRKPNPYSKFKQRAAPKQDEYFIYNKYENRYYYHNSLYNRVMNALSDAHIKFGMREFNVVEEPVVNVEGAKVTFDKHTLNLVEPEDSPFSFQNEIVDFALEPDTHHRIFEVQTGRGKTKMALKTAVKYGQRTLIITKSAYVSKWIGDVTDNLGLDKGELVVPKTTKQFLDLIEIGKAGRMEAIDKSDKDIKVILLSSSILDNWIHQWLDGDDRTHPTELCRTLGVGMIIYDESHQLFRKNYWSFLLLDTCKFLDLSATLQPDETDTFMKERYMERFPSADRYSGLEFNKYIDAYSIYYGISDPKLRKKMNKMPMYNHTTFEGYVETRPECKKAYFNMLITIIKQWYMGIRAPGEKALIFFATKTMCTDFRDFAAKVFPDIKVTRNIQGDDYDEFVSGELCVSTPGKSGTAIDIPGLILCIVTVAISRTQMNLQIIGRSRDLRKPDKFPKAVFMHCSDIKKHMQYLNKRMKIFDGKVRSFRVLTSKFSI